MSYGRFLRAGVALLIPVLIAGCGGDGDDPSVADGTLPASSSVNAIAPATSAPTSASSTTTTTLAPPATAPDGTEWTREQVAAIGIYRKYEEAVRVASAVSDPNLPALLEATSGELLANNQAQLLFRRDAGQAVRPSEKKAERFEAIRVVARPDGVMNVVLCRVDDAVVYRVADGTVVNDDVVTRRIGVLVKEAKVVGLGVDKDLQWSGDEMRRCLAS